MIYIFYAMCAITIFVLITMSVQKPYSPKAEGLEHAHKILREHDKACRAVKQIKGPDRERYIVLIRNAEKDMSNSLKKLEEMGVEIPQWKSVDKY